MSEAERAMKVAQQKFDRIGTQMATAGKNLSLAITAPVAAFGVLSFKTASDAAELQSAFNETFGSMADDMTAWAETTGDAMGRSTQELQRAANTFGIFFNQAAGTREEAAKMSQTFTVLSQDLASFYNVSESDALQKLRSGLAGEAEPLRDFGVFLSAAAVEAKAMEMGLADASGEISEQAKIMARYQLILESTKNAQGDVARTSSGTANQMRAAKAAFEELQVTIGTKLLPMITPLIEKLASAINWFAKLPGPVQDTILVVAGLAAALGPVLYVVGNLTSAFGILLPVLMKLGPAFVVVRTAALALMANPVILAFAAVVTGIYLAWKNWDKIKPYIDAVGKAVSDFWNGKVKPALDAVGKAIVGTIRFFLGLRQKAIQAIIQMGAAIWAKLREIAGQMLAIGRQIIMGLVNGIKANAAAVWNALKDVVMGGINKVRGWLGIKSPSRVFMGIGSFITQGLAIGISAERNQTNMAMRSVVDGILNEMRRIDGLTDEVKEEFTELRSLLDRLFPAQARQRQFEIDKGRIDGSTLPDELKAEANKRLIDDSFPEIREALATMVEGTKNAFGQVGGFIAETFDNAAETVADAVVEVQSRLTALEVLGGAAFDELGRGISDVLFRAKSLGDALRDIVSRLAEMAFNMALQALGASAGIPGFAGGTMSAPGGLALVGERGPELVNLPRGAGVMTNRELQSLARNGSANSNNITVHVNGAMDPRQAREAGGQIARRLRRELNGPVAA